MNNQNIENKETADHNEQQLNKLHEILFELCVLNKNLKNISDTLLYISQYGIITK